MSCSSPFILSLFLDQESGPFAYYRGRFEPVKLGLGQEPRPRILGLWFLAQYSLRATTFSIRRGTSSNESARM